MSRKVKIIIWVGSGLALEVILLTVVSPGIQFWIWVVGLLCWLGWGIWDERTQCQDAS